MEIALLALFAIFIILTLVQGRKLIMTQDEIIAKIQAAEDKEDAQSLVLAHIKTEVDALKALIAGGADLSAVGAKVDELSGKIDAGSSAIAAIDTDAAG